MRGSFRWVVAWALLALALEVRSAAQTAPTAAPGKDFAGLLFSSTVWQDGKLPGTWLALPPEPQRQGRELKPVVPMLGVTPKRVIAWFERDKLARLDVLLAQGTATEVAAAETATVQALQALCGQSGQAAALPVPGKGWDFEGVGTLFRLSVEPGKRVTLAALPSLRASVGNVPAAVTTSPGKPKKLEDNVEKLDNGDVIIRHLPAPLMEGDAAYIGLYHVLMLQALYGWAGDYNKLLRDMGWSPGNDTFVWHKYYTSVAKQAKTRVEMPEPFNFDEVCRAIQRGHPVIVWDATEDVRTRYHVDFAAKFKADGRLELPPARDADEQKKWPRYQSESNAGAMMIVGINKRRGEIIFSRQDLGTDHCELRMRKEEIAFTAGTTYIFQP